MRPRIARFAVVVSLASALGLGSATEAAAQATGAAPTTAGSPTAARPTAGGPTAIAGASTGPGPTLEIRIGGVGQNGPWGSALNVLLMMTVLTLTPAILVSVTSFTRILISLHFLRQAIGTQSAPGNQVLIGLALFVTFFVMQPVATKVNEVAIAPVLAGEIDGPAGLAAAWPPLRDFMLPQTRTKDVALFQELAKVQGPMTATDVPAHVLIPAFLISEIKTAFQIGVLLYLPFLMLDMIVASVLLALGMMMLPPVVISTPLKLMLFVLVDGWNLVIGALVRSVL